MCSVSLELRIAILIGTLAVCGLAVAEEPPQTGTPPRERLSPAGIFATTVPRGTTRFRLLLDYAAVKFNYEEEDLTGETGLWEAKFFETMAAVSVTYGVTDHWELGFALPVVSTSFEADPTDCVDCTRASSSDTGLGNVRFLLGNGYSWRGGADTLLVELEAGLPTDSRDELFAAGGNVRLSVLGEHYWDYCGFIGYLSGNHLRDSDSEEGPWIFEYLLGVGLDLSRRWFASILAGQTESVPRIEIEGQFFPSSTNSVRLFFGLDADAPHTRYVGLRWTVLSGGSKNHDPR
jgi:hypothetical protein